MYIRFIYTLCFKNIYSYMFAWFFCTHVTYLFPILSMLLFYISGLKLAVSPGEFHNNDMHGEGVYTWSDGRGYSGQWTHNTMAPKGKMWWSDGRTYLALVFCWGMPRGPQKRRVLQNC